jgi:hypothetical protein
VKQNETRIEHKKFIDMDEQTKSEKSSFNWLWPAIISVVVVALLAIQIIRVNTSGETPVATTKPIKYSTPGPVISGNIKIGAGEFLSNQINLNRRAKLSGEFDTGSVKSKVSVLVVDEANFEKWKLQTDFKSQAVTGYVPVGRISPVLEPGTYFLILDNRANADPRSVEANFVLE